MMQCCRTKSNFQFHRMPFTPLTDMPNITSTDCMRWAHLEGERGCTELSTHGNQGFMGVMHAPNLFNPRALLQLQS